MAPGLVLEIDLSAAVPAYRQIADQLRHGLVAGWLAAGAALPSVRRLAAELGVHHNTVAEAYRTLAGEGWLELSQGRAVRVAERGRPPALTRDEREEVAQSFETRVRHLAAEVRARGLSAARVARVLQALAAEVA